MTALQKQEQTEKWDADDWSSYIQDMEEKEKQEKDFLEYVPDMDTPKMTEGAQLLEFFQSSSSYGPGIRNNLEQALGRLPLQQMAVLRGFFERGLKTKSIARELNISQNSVKMAKSRALKKLRSLLVSKKGCYREDAEKPNKNKDLRPLFKGGCYLFSEIHN